MTSGEKMAAAADRMVSLRDEDMRSGPDPRPARIPDELLYPRRPNQRWIRYSGGHYIEQVLLVNHDGFEKKETCDADEKYLRVRRKVNIKSLFKPGADFSPECDPVEHVMCFERSLEFTPDGMAIFREMEL